LGHAYVLTHPTTFMETSGVLLAKLARSAYTISFPQ
jgi:peptidyl-tRNA hydrolase